ncbi:hypothetical protein [Psychroserpens sp. MEBiC05023]
MKVLLPIFILFWSLLSFAQNVEKGEIVKDRQFLIDKKELTSNDIYGNFVAVRPHRINGTIRNYYIEFFSELNFEDRIEIETSNDTDILDVFILNEKAHIFIKEREDQSISLRLDIIDLRSKKVSKNELLKVDKDSNKPLFKALKHNYFINLEVSEHLILNFPVIEDKITYAYIKVFSQELSEVTQYNCYADDSVSHKNTSFLNAKYVHDKIYALFQLNNNTNEAQRFYRLIELTKKGKRFLDIEVPIDSYELINSGIKNNHMIIAGLYSKSKKGGFKGFTFYNINLDTFEVESQNQSAFLNEKAQRYFTGLFKGNRRIDINNIFIDDQLNTYITGRFYILIKQSVPIGIPIASFTTGAITTFITVNPISYSYKVFDDILFGKINPKGELNWDNILELRQTEKIDSKSNKRDSSTFTYFENNEIHVILNGFIDTEKTPLIVKQDKRMNKTNFYDISINTHGGISPKIIFPNSEADIIFKAESVVKSNDIIHVLGQGNMRKQLLKLKL